MPPHVTVVLPTHRRPASLRRALDGLARQRDPGVPWDVVVVDNDATPSASLPAIPVAARVVWEPVPGASSARNRGIAEASGTIVAFLDDDVVPDDGWLAPPAEPLLPGRCDGVGGRVTLAASTSVPSWIPRWLRP